MAVVAETTVGRNTVSAVTTELEPLPDASVTISAVLKKIMICVNRSC